MSLPILTYWDSSVKNAKIEKKQANALKKLLVLLGAQKVNILKNNVVEAHFDTWENMEKAKKDILFPLQMLFSKDNIESVYGKVNFGK